MATATEMQETAWANPEIVPGTVGLGGKKLPPGAANTGRRPRVGPDPESFSWRAGVNKDHNTRAFGNLARLEPEAARVGSGSAWLKSFVRPVSLSSFLQWRVNAAAISVLPSWVSRFMLAILGRLYFLLAGSERREIKLALDFCLKKRPSPADGGNYWRLTRRGIFSHYHEKLLLGFRPFRWVRRMHLSKIEIEGLEELNRALRRNRGAILVSGHFGAIEYLPGALAFRGFPVTVMVHCKSENLRKKLEKKSQAAGAKLLDPKAENVFFQAVEHLRQGRIIITQCDELNNWHPYPNRRINFLGVEMGLDRTLDILARKSNSPVLFGLNHRLGGGRYRLSLETIDELPATRPVGSISAQCLNLLIENIYLEPWAWYEWKKLGRILDRTLVRDEHEDRQRLGIPRQMAVCPSNPS